MSSLWSTLAWVFGSALVGGVFAAALRRLGAPVPPRVLGGLTGTVLWALIFFMGFALGSDTDLVQRIPEVGLLALVFAVLSAGFSVLSCILFFSLVIRPRPKATSGRQSGSLDADSAIPGSPAAGHGNSPARRLVGDEPARSMHPLSGDQEIPSFSHAAEDRGGRSTTAPGNGRAQFDNPATSAQSLLHRTLRILKEPAVMIGALACGILVGYLSWSAFGFDPPDSGRVSTVLLYTLLFLSGAGMVGHGSASLGSIWHWRSLALPLLTVAGSLAGGAAAGMLLGIGIREGMAGTAGFGWYSLAGVLISDLGYPILGGAAFLGNLMRESLAVVSIPLLAKLGQPEAAISIAGATSMDVTLPLIGKFAGHRWLGPSLLHGTLLSLLVPLLIPIILP